MSIRSAPPTNSGFPESSHASGLPGAHVNRRGAAERRFQQGLFAYHRGDYSLALKELERSLEATTYGRAGTRDHAHFVECCTYVLRILAEREEFARIEKIEARVLVVLSTTALPAKLKSRAKYVLGICSCYQASRHEQAMNHFRDSIDYAIESGDNESLAAPLYGAATVLYARGRHDDALRELDRLDVLLSCLQLPDIASAAHLLRAMIRRNQKRMDEALQSAWAAFESLKHHPHLVLYLHTLCTLGTIYHMRGDAASAKVYLDLANRGLKRDEFPRIARLVDEALAEVGSTGPSYDLMFDTRTGVLIEKSLGEIRFEGQFVLRDLLRLFLEKPGHVFTKEDLVRHVWREDYAAETHDNKIYVTIKRLRKLLETPANSTEYILRAKAGYFLNPKVKVIINEKKVAPAVTEGHDGKKMESV
jgi:tetratricopeptide (TPR) repeat protein